MNTTSFPQPFMQGPDPRNPSVSGMTFGSDYDHPYQFDTSFLQNHVSSPPINSKAHFFVPKLAC